MCLLSLAVISFMACDDDVKRSDSPAFNAESMQVYFSKDNQNDFQLLPTEKQIELIVCRDSTTEAATVKIGLKAGDNFSISNVKFDAGDADTTLVVSFDTLAPFEVNYLELSIENKYCNPYVTNANGTSVFSCSVTVTDWADYAYGTFTSGFWEDSWEQVMQYSEILKYYRLADVYGNGYHILFDFDAETGEITPQYKTDSNGYYPLLIGEVGDYGMATMSIDSSIDYTWYDAANQLFNFNGKFTVSAGSFGWYDEQFQIESLANAE